MTRLTIIKSAAVLTLSALTLACGYSSKPAPAVAGSMPTISTLNPNSATAGAPGFPMTVNGSNFATNAVVNWNGTAMTGTTYITGKQLMINVPASAIANSGTVQVTVTNPATGGTGPYGGGGTLAETSAPMTFTIN
jgi:hypothetical protein